MVNRIVIDMKKLFATLSFSVLALCTVAADGGKGRKQVYIPEDLQGMDLHSDTAQWSFSRSVETDDIIIMWERGFGADVQQAPPLDGRPMTFDLGVLTRRLQHFYDYYRDTLQFTLPGSKAERYKMMVMVNYSLDGTAYGGTYDNFIGALWVAPNRIQDTTMNCMAHELGHSFQLQIPADSTGEAWGGSPFYEMTSQWMLWQVNPWWLRDENFHFEAFKGLTHRAFLHIDNIYHSPFVIQWWSDLHGKASIARLYREGRRGEDPVSTYKRLWGMSQREFCDEMLLGYQHLLNFDFSHARRETRPYACTFASAVEDAGDGWLKPKDAPEEYGFNAVSLDHLLAQRQPRRVSVNVSGQEVSHAFVAVTAGGQSVYSPIGTAYFKLPPHTKHLYLLVMGAPKEHHQLYAGGHGGIDARKFPYKFRVSTR